MTARISVNCLDCHTFTRIYQPDKPQTSYPPKYCPYCGSDHTTISQSNEQDWRDAMEESYGVPWSDLSPLYNLWCNQRAVPRFKDYLVQLIQQASAVTAATSTTEVADEANANPR